MGLSIQQFDDLVELWDEEGQPPDIDWLEYAQDFRNRTQSARAIMEKFVNKVDTGMARSTETYRDMKAWLEE